MRRKHYRRIGLIMLLFFMAGFGTVDVAEAAEPELPEPILEYNFEEESGNSRTVTDRAGDNDGVLKGNVTFRQDKKRNSRVLNFSGMKSYLEFPEGFFDGRDTMTISMDVYSLMGNDNFFTLAIGKDSNKYFYIRTREGQTDCAMTRYSYGMEQGVTALGEFRETWTNVTAVLEPGSIKLYINGEPADVEAGLVTKISDLGQNLSGYLGKSFYDGDVYFKGYIDNVIIYEEVLSAMEIAKMQGVTLAPFREIKTADASMVTWQADKETKEVTVYISRSNLGDAERTELEFILQEHASLVTECEILVSAEDTKTVEFAVEQDGETVTESWTVKTMPCNNPVVSGQFADPDIDIFGDKYYLYMNTDGYSGWSGTQFHVFSSENLVDWTDEGIILDVASDDVAWSTGSAWAPTIEEKNGKYYFYFCAKDNTGVSCIGVAVAEQPEGPYTAMPEPLMTMDICRKYGISMGQTIDPSIFTDEDGISYMLFGNGDGAVVRLNEDMVSMDLSTFTHYEGTYGLREAITVTKRDGIYHFTWSCDDTGSPDYHVNYGVSDSIYGPIEYKYTVLEKRTEQDILGTGHHCMLHIPGTDEYYIAYHRFYTPLGVFTEGLGFHRETCIDKVTFDAETGLMNVITPTLEGVEARYLKTTAEQSGSEKEGKEEEDAGETSEFQESETMDEDVPGTAKKSPLKGILVSAGVALAALGGALLFFKKRKK